MTSISLLNMVAGVLAMFAPLFGDNVPALRDPAPRTEPETRLKALVDGHAELWQEYIRRSNEPVAMWWLDVSLKEMLENGSPRLVKSWPTMSVCEKVPFESQTNETILTKGSAADLLDAKDGQASSADAVPLGSKIHGAVRVIDARHVRLDLTLQQNEVDNAGKTHVVIAGQTYRVAQQGTVGTTMKAVLQSDRNGEPRLWLEWKLTLRKVDIDTAPSLPPLPASKNDIPAFHPWSAPVTPAHAKPSKSPAAQVAERTQVRFLAPVNMKVTWHTKGPDGKAGFSATPVEAPGRYNFAQGAIYRLKLADLPGRPGLELYPTLEIVPSTAKTREYLAHNAAPLEFTDEEFRHVIDGKHLVKVVYLMDPALHDEKGAVVHFISSMRLEPRQDPIQEALRRGSILFVVRMGNADHEVRHAPPLQGSPKTTMPEFYRK